MDIIVCLDDKGGMLFNKRRQSKDRAVLEDMKGCLSAPLTIDAFSEKLFADTGIDYRVGEPEESGVFFAENVKISEIVDTCTRIVIYKWNRIYPSDFKFDIDLPKEGFVLKSTKDFAGTSHEKITREIYER